MAFSPKETKEIQEKINDFLDAIRPPEVIRDEFDLDCRIHDDSVIIYELNPLPHVPAHLRELEIIKATFVDYLDVWEIFLKPGNREWELYELEPEVLDLDAFFDMVKEAGTHTFLC